MDGTTLNELARKAGMIPVFSHDDINTAQHVVACAYEAGVRVFEFTNRSEGALRVFEQLVLLKKDFPGLVFGAGTILNGHDASEFIKAGAEFIVSPGIDEEVASFCKEKNVSWSPGCGTISEIMRAKKLGASLIKVFPANLYGPGLIKATMSVLQDVSLMPTGGITPDHECLKSWFDAGVTCVGMGSQLFSSDLIENGKQESLVRSISNVLEIINKIRSEKIV